MLSHVAEWVGAVLAVGVVAGLVVLAAAAAAGWLLYRRLRRRVATLTSTAARSALQAIGPVAGGRVRLPPRVVHDLRRRLNGPPEAW